MDAWQSEHIEDLYRKASASPLWDAAYQLWREREWLNSMEQVDDAPFFSPLPDKPVPELLPEIVRRTRLQSAVEKDHFADCQTMKRLHRCQPLSTMADRMAALDAAARMKEEIEQRCFTLLKEKAGSETACLRMAFELTKAENPGFSESSYNQARHDIAMGML